MDRLKGLTVPKGCMALDIQSQAVRTHTHIHALNYMLACTHAKVRHTRHDSKVLSMVL